MQGLARLADTVIGPCSEALFKALLARGLILATALHMNTHTTSLADAKLLQKLRGDTATSYPSRLDNQ